MYINNLLHKNDWLQHFKAEIVVISESDPHTTMLSTNVLPGEDVYQKQQGI